MEPTLPQAKEVPRSELDTVIHELRTWRWVVVPFMSSTPWGYVVWLGDRDEYEDGRVVFDMVVPKDR